jgi:hypothetical protein
MKPLLSWLTSLRLPRDFSRNRGGRLGQVAEYIGKQRIVEMQVNRVARIGIAGMVEQDRNARIIKVRMRSVRSTSAAAVSQRLIARPRASTGLPPTRETRPRNSISGSCTSTAAAACPGTKRRPHASTSAPRTREMLTRNPL